MLSNHVLTNEQRYACETLAEYIVNAAQAARARKVSGCDSKAHKHRKRGKACAEEADRLKLVDAEVGAFFSWWCTGLETCHEIVVRNDESYGFISVMPLLGFAVAGV